MLAANLPVCQYAGMPAQSNSNNGGANNNNTNTNSVKPNNSGSCTSGTIGPNSNNNNAGNSTSGVGLVGGGTSAAAAKNQLEQLNTMREALFSQDGWGCQHVNQDTNWEVPSSPEPTNKDPSAGPTMWKPTINNGTDLWELNLRNGGQPPVQPVQKTPWGHTPSSNLGGTWGEDDDGTESSSVWTGSSNNPSTAGTVGVTGVNATAVGGNGPGNNAQWGQTAVGIVVGSTNNTTGTASGNIGNASTVGGGTGVPGVNVPGNVNTATASGSTGSNWGDSRELNSGGVTSTVTLRGVDPRDPIRGTSAAETRDLRLIDPRDPIRGDPRGISGRLNGTSEMWGQHHSIAHNQIPVMNKIVGPGVGVGATVSTGAVVAGGSVAGGIVPGNINAINPVGISGNVNAHWGPSSAVVGPKDITSMAGKVTGWEEPSPPPQRRNIPNYDDGTSLWGQQSRVPGGSGSHWKDISDPLSRHLTRNTVGNQNTTNAVGNLGNSSGNGLGNNQAVVNASIVGSNANNPISSVGPQGRLSSGVGPGVGVNQHKPDNSMWVHASNPNVSARNTTSWGDEVNHNVGPNPGVNWMDDKSNAGIGQLGVSVGGANSWNDPPSSWSKNQNKIASGTSGWGASGGSDGTELSSDWNTHTAIVGKTQPKIGGVNVNISNLNTDVIKQSKQYRVLVENGFKKEDVERALINTNMNIEEAADLLRAPISTDWRRHEESLVSYSDHTNAGGSFAGRYPTTASQSNMPFPPNMLNSMSGNSAGVSGNNTNLAALNSIQSLPVQKYLNPVPHNVTNVPQAMNTAVTFGPGVANVSATVNATPNSNSQPSAQQLRVLVQQIQLAVHSGYLSSQILSEPLPSSMLVLLYQLLTNIKHLQAAQQSLTRGGNNANNSQISYAIAKYKQQIQNLQNQINAHQAFILKQKQQQSIPQNTQQHPAAHANNSNMEYMRQHDAISALQGNFSEMNLTKHSGYPGGPNSQSKLINQWKLPEKDLTSDSTDFSRAPGTTKQNLSNAPGSTMGPLGLQNDGTWSTGRNIGDGWPDSSTENENKDWSVAQPTSAATYTDLVQEFEPGKPWKGSQIKSIEDDPSITPGSVARSPLSINSTPKEADIFANPSKSSPTDLTPLSLSSSTWSFNPSSSNQAFQSPQQCAPSELWATSMNKSSRGPPPGLGSGKSPGVSGTGVPSVTNSSSVVTGSANQWMVTGGRGVPNSNSGWNASNSGWNSTWLLLKNLTTQIDGSTLRTLCMQHGPLANFHLYLNQGIALCKYATREEANKAQMSLNNCDFGSTTICAESPSESEVQKILQHLPQTSNSVSGSSLTGNGSNAVNNSNNGSVIGGNNSITSGSGNSGGPCSTVGGASGGNGNGSMTAHSVISSTGSNNGCSGNLMNSGSTGSNSSSGNSQSQSGSVGLSSNGGKTSNTSNIASGNGGSNVTSNNIVGSNNAVTTPTWRQTQNQPRPSGRDEYDYISQYVCSIVDD
ncbi:protein Gawky isoform X2 [Bactrocera oleae]|uniref:protein Gawky isoform X2 n=1 Tax=Bactrocera oleae TaxID=104688 RepID=UPI0006B7424E|nr:protein Gawky isoform X2 [Bactrocera oleae]XP_036223041.1 protein Gawky isoform X2 [Bactrocera oleae]XP_036223042.1 protein Gawky isoform X2 [Bactrocera oleae]XP_036223043.1 protein Gawky isoform X2 [Bactrocera oleae]